MTRLGWGALSAAVALSAVSIYDAIYHGLTGQGSFASDQGPEWGQLMSSGVLTLTFGLLAAVLVLADRSIDRSRWVRSARRLLIADLAVLAIVFATDMMLGRIPAALEAVAGVAFLLMFVLGLVLGALLVRTPVHRLPALLMMAPVALIPGMLVLNLIAPGWSHPGYAESTLYIGIALLAGRTTDRPTNRPLAPAQPRPSNTQA
jgi:hypothetical protein